MIVMEKETFWTVRRVLVRTATTLLLLGLWSGALLLAAYGYSERAIYAWVLFTIYASIFILWGASRLAPRRDWHAVDKPAVDKGR